MAGGYLLGYDAAMISSAFTTLIYEPLYNTLVFFVAVVPGWDVGVAVILLTILVKVLLFPFSLKSLRTQLKLRTLEPELKSLKERHKSDPQAQARAMMELYRSNQVRPFLSFFLVLVQLPIIFGLYWVFYKGGLPVVAFEHLYSFIPIPLQPSMEFLGIIDISAKHNIFFALLVGTSQYFQVILSLPPLPPRAETASVQDDFARSMQLNMRYVLPVILAGVTYVLPAAVGLYWMVNNLFTIAQEWYVRRKYAKEQGEVTTSVPIP
jgi:YidC/Oxa1 family membrane protein insertase